jgi:hypothetical protein
VKLVERISVSENARGGKLVAGEAGEFTAPIHRKPRSGGGAMVNWAGELRYFNNRQSSLDNHQSGVRAAS